MFADFIPFSEEEDPDEYPFPLTLRTKQPGATSPLGGIQLNGN
jgi:glycogen synthase